MGLSRNLFYCFFFVNFPIFYFENKKMNTYINIKLIVQTDQLCIYKEKGPMKQESSGKVFEILLDA